jgi:hypothetical protein
MSPKERRPKQGEISRGIVGRIRSPAVVGFNAFAKSELSFPRVECFSSQQMLNRSDVSVEVDALEHQVLPPSAQAENSLYAVVALVHACGVADHAGHEPVACHDPGGDRDADAEDWADQVDKDEHAGVENAVFIGVRWKWRVDRFELEVEGGPEE